MMKNIYLMVVVFVLCSSVAFGINETIKTSHVNMGTGGNTNNFYGNSVTFTNGTAILLNITMYQADEGTRCSVYNSTDMSPPANLIHQVNVGANKSCDFSGNPIEFANGTKIYVVLDGVDWKMRYSGSRVVDLFGQVMTYHETNCVYNVGTDLVNMGGYSCSISTITAMQVEDSGAVNGSIDIIFVNESGTIKTTFDEGENFFVHMNYTSSDNGTPFTPPGNCSVNVEGGILEQGFSAYNFSVCTTGCNYSVYEENFTVTDPSDTIYHGIHFYACHKQISNSNLFVSICGNVTMIPNLFIPQCSDNHVFQRLDVSNCSGLSSVTMQVWGDGATANKGIDVYGAYFDAEYNNVSAVYLTEVYYNLSSKVFVTNESIEYFKHGNKNIYADCTHPTSSYNKAVSESITIVNAPPVLNILGVNNTGGFFPISSGVVFEYYGGVWQFIGSVIDDDLDTAVFNITNRSGDVLFNYSFNVPPGRMSINASILADFDGNPFNVSAWANDSAGDFSYKSILFNVSDTGPPSCTGFSDETIYNGSVYTFSTTCTDENFYSFNLSCSNGVSNYSSGLNVQEFEYVINWTMNQTTNCNLRACDGHTAEELSKDFYAVDDGDEVKVSHKDSDVLFKAKYRLDVESLEIERLSDRISFTFTFPEHKGIDTYVFYYETSRGSHHLESEKYPGWIVDPSSETWFDSLIVNDPDAIIKVVPINATLWEISVTTIEDTLIFSSIGELNCVDYSNTITMVNVPDGRVDTVPEAMIMIFLMLLWLIMLVLTLMLKGERGGTIQYLNLLQMFFGFVAGSAWIPIYFLIGFPVVLVAVGFFIGLIVYERR